MKKIFIKISKILTISIILTLVILFSVFTVFAADTKYYMVEGRIYSDGRGEISRIGTVESSGGIKSGAGREYAVVAVDYDGNNLYSTALDINFKSSSDVGVPLSKYCEFIAMLPYDQNIVWLYLVDSEYNELDYSSPYTNIQDEIKYFTVEETGAGFNIKWDVSVWDDSYFEYLDYNVIAVSQKTGEKNVLAYRTTENHLELPYDWLDPNDTVKFMLESNDTFSTLVAESEAFGTPDGDDKSFVEDWYENDDYHYYVYDDSSDLIVLIFIIIIGLIVIAAVVLIFILIMQSIKKKKDKNKNKEKPKKEIIPKEPKEPKPTKAATPVTPVVPAAPAAVTAKLSINGTEIKTDSPAVMENKRVYLPVRVIAEALGYISAWNSETQIINIYNTTTKELLIAMTIGSEKAKVSIGIQDVMDERGMDVPAKLINGGAYAPARFIADTLKFKFEWDVETEIVNITQE